MLQKTLQFTTFLDQESSVDMEKSSQEEIQRMGFCWITKTQFISWANQRPLIIDWLRCHEEFVQSKPSEVKHQAKCNQCLVYPIEGILFKCFKCPNFDLCDTCYLAKAFHHKETHDFRSITTPVTVNKTLLQGSLVRKLSKKITKSSRENSVGERAAHWH